MDGDPRIVAAILLERAILRQYRQALVEEWKGRRRADFLIELRQQIRAQGFRIAALKRINGGLGNG